MTSTDRTTRRLIDRWWILTALVAGVSWNPAAVRAQSGAATAAANAAASGTPIPGSTAAPAAVPGSVSGGVTTPSVTAPATGAVPAVPAAAGAVAPLPVEAPSSNPSAPAAAVPPAQPSEPGTTLPAPTVPGVGSDRPEGGGSASPEVSPFAPAPAPAEVALPATPGRFLVRDRPRGFFAVARESIFGPADDPPWQPLPLRTFFTEGWRDPWIAPPNGSGGAPRQGWIGAPDGNFYRLYWFSYIENFNVAQGGNGYASRFNLYTPLSRRLLLITTIPYLNSNSPSFNLGTSDFGSSGAATAGQTVTGQGTSFGDITFTPRLMLKETQDLSLSAQVGIQIPTGSTRSGAGRALLSPGVQFWYDIGAGWAVRGGFNVGVGTNSPGAGVTLISQLALGRTILPHDVPIFGDLTYYLAVNQSNQVVNGKSDTVTLGPGFRTHLGKDYYLLGALTVPVTDFKPYQQSMTFWLMKTF